MDFPLYKISKAYLNTLWHNQYLLFFPLQYQTKAWLALSAAPL